MIKPKKRPLYIHYAGPILLETSLLNKGSAFPASERKAFNLNSLLPVAIESIEEQENRAYHQFSKFDRERSIFCVNKVCDLTRSSAHNVVPSVWKFNS